MKATASDVEKDKEQAETTNDIEKGIYATQPTTASDVKKAVPESKDVSD